MNTLENTFETIILHYFSLIKNYEIVFDRIKYLIILKSNISDFFFSQIYKNQIDSDNDFNKKL